MCIYVYTYLKNEFEKDIRKLNRNKKKSYRCEAETSS